LHERAGVNGGSAVSLVTLVLWELAHPHPVVNIRLLGYRSFGICCGLMFLVGFLLISTTQLLPQLAQTLLSYDATSAGLTLGIGGIVRIELQRAVERAVGIAQRQDGLGELDRRHAGPQGRLPVRDGAGIDENLRAGVPVKAVEIDQGNLQDPQSPIVERALAVGETIDERRAGATDDRVLSQTRAAFDGIAAPDLSKVAIAYEPIWAIGTGQSCEPDEANRVMATIRLAIDGLGGTPILYGGSMTAANVGSYVKRSNINGGLIGGASLDPEGFATLIERAVSS